MQPLARPRAVAQRQPLALESESQLDFCIRSDVHRNRMLYDAWTSHNGVSWLSGEQRRGRWGLGCTLCAQYWAAGRKCENARFAKFARLSCNPASRKEAKWLLEQHQQTRSHRIASGQLKASGSRRKRRVDTPSPRPCAQTLSCPNFGHSEASLDRAAEDAALLKGNVPSAHEWKDAWSILSERCSLRSGARMFEKKHSQEQSAP